jgi:demethylmenaquinone methyltransferase/2-methoxy-6-polyprenyl-1,4-benzoquinol methylase
VSSSGLQPLARKIFEGLYESYDRVLEAATLMQDRYWKRWIVSKASLRDGMAILDVGCGTGVLEESLNEMGLSVIGVDLTEEMIRLAQHKRMECIECLAVGDAEHLPFKDSSFDVVFSCYVVKYCRPEKLASEIMRVLRPEGRVLLYDFSSPRGFFAPFHAFYVYGVLRIFGLVLKRVDPGLAFTYIALPSVIRERKWDDFFGNIMGAYGFSEIGCRRLSGGVVTAFWGKKA